MEDKEKVNISIDIEKQLNEKLEKIKANKSELIDYLLEEYFKSEEKKEEK